MIVKRICILLLIPIFFSCVKNEYKTVLPDVEKIKIVFYDDEYNEDYFIELSDKQEVSRFMHYMKNILLPITPGANIDGKIGFYNKNDQILIDASFNIDFRNIVFAYNGENYQLRISDDGIKYLNKVREEMLQNRLNN
jgi:hypothetical protein